ncbi:endolysin [Streptomyces phage phiScoe10]|nr:endolysin [Streptomyces phage phiScoe10]
MSVSIVSRSAWGAKPWNGTPDAVSLSQRTEFFVHYHGGVPPHSTGVGVPREVEKIHLAQDWAGTGYNFMVDQDGVIYEGRGWGLKGAHCPDHNVSGFGVYVAIGGDQKPSEKALASVRALYDEACAKTGKALAKKGHKDGFATACPGGPLYAWVQAGMPVKAAPAPAPVKPAPVKPKPATKPNPIYKLAAAVKPGATHVQVRDIQELLMRLGYKIPGAPSNFYGKNTEAAVAAWHERNPKYKNYGVARDTRLGPSGYIALQKQCGRR